MPFESMLWMTGENYCCPSHSHFDIDNRIVSSMGCLLAENQALCITEGKKRRSTMALDLMRGAC